jgi:hypothetical protein
VNLLQTDPRKYGQSKDAEIYRLLNTTKDSLQAQRVKFQILRLLQQQQQQAAKYYWASCTNGLVDCKGGWETATKKPQVNKHLGTVRPYDDMTAIG